MVQPEIAFINKLTKMRRFAETKRANLKPGVMPQVKWLELHIKANGYTSERTAKSFFRREIERVRHIMFWDKPKLVEEFNKLKSE